MPSLKLEFKLRPDVDSLVHLWGVSVWTGLDALHREGGSWLTVSQNTARLRFVIGDLKWSSFFDYRRWLRIHEADDLSKTAVPDWLQFPVVLTAYTLSLIHI